MCIRQRTCGGDATKVTPKDTVSRHINVQEHKHRRKDEETSICPNIPSHRSSFRTSPHRRPSTQVGNSKHGKEKDKTKGRDQSQGIWVERSRMCAA